MNKLLIVNFGGPRDLSEVSEFLCELLCDQDVIQTRFPAFFHNWLFTRIARKRALKVSEDYEIIGGGSPIFKDTESLAQALNGLTFHRYLPKTHKISLDAIENIEAEEIRVLPLFPQFTYATTGSIARFFSLRLSKTTQKKLRWIKSYPDHPYFISAFEEKIRKFLQENTLNEKHTFLLFSAHGVPQKFIDQGDPYQRECEKSFQALSKSFPSALSLLAYQSKFGRGEWIKPYTLDVCQNIKHWAKDRKNVVFIPLSFTSDHIETLFEIEYQYLPLVKDQGYQAYRCPALNLEKNWITALQNMIQNESIFWSNQELIRSS